MKAFIITCLSSILSVSILNAAAINIETSGDKGKDAGDVSVHYLDKIGNIGLQNTKVGIPTPDLIQDSATLSGENTFRKIDCKTIFIVGRCVIHVFGGLNVERFLPSPNSVTPPELIITDASIKETYFSVFFDTKTTPSLSKGGCV